MLLLSDEHEFCASLIRQAFIVKTPPKNQICFSNKAASIIIRLYYKIISVSLGNMFSKVFKSDLARASSSFENEPRILTIGF